MKFNDEFDHILEGFGYLKTVKKEFYPKNFKLSEEFVKSFKSEYKRLLDEGMHPRLALARINKALMFHTR